MLSHHPHSRLRSILVLSVAIALLLAGCGESLDRPREQQEARLIVQEVLPAVPVYTEGSVSFLRVKKSDTDEIIAAGPMTDGAQIRGRDPLLNKVVEPGEYQIVSFQRPCAGTCQQLDDPTDRCETTATLTPGKTLFATVLLRQEGGCSISKSFGRADIQPRMPSEDQ